MKEMIDDLWGWIAPAIVYLLDHITMAGAVILFILQAIYQTYKIVATKREAHLRECQITNEENKQ